MRTEIACRTPVRGRETDKTVRHIEGEKTGGRTADMVIEVTAFDRPTRLANSTTLSTMDI